MDKPRATQHCMALFVALVLLTTACAPEGDRAATALATPEPPPTSAAQSPTPTLGAVLAPTVAPGAAAPTAAMATQSRRGLNPAAEVYRLHGASVVSITSVALVRSGQGTAEQPQGSGSGFILDDKGHIVTNNHVVEEADQLTVTFQDRTTVPARLVGRDPDNDLAVVAVDPDAKDEEGKPIRDRIRPVTLSDSDRIVIGEDAIAIGSPLGLAQTVTTGIVSAIRAPGEELGSGDFGLLGGAVQTDAAINPGNSGGPLFNASGEVIGVNTAGLSPSGGSIGLGFAIPSNTVKRVAPALIAKGCYEHPLVGITSLALARVGQAAKRELGLPQKGLLVQEVTAGAAQAGLRAGSRAISLGGERVRLGGDIVVAVDGRPVVGAGDLRGYIENQKRPGDRVTLTVLRDSQRLDLPVTLASRTTPNTCR